MNKTPEPVGDDTPRRPPKSSWAGRPAEPTHLQGRIERPDKGVCLHLDSGGVVYELVGAPTGLVVGQTATVRGHVDRTVSSQCGRGVPFVVTSAEPQPADGG
jgi:hypothetical protein